MASFCRGGKAVLPLPKGEGWGEGKERDKTDTRRRYCAQFPLTL